MEDTRHMEDKTKRTKQDTTKQYSPPRMHRMLRKSKTMEDKTGQNTTHYTSRNHRDPGLGYSERFRKACRRNTLDKTDKHDSTGQRENVAPKGHDTLRNRNALGNLFRKSQFIHKFTRKMLRPKTRTHIFCEAAQSKCTSTFHKSHFRRKFTGEMPCPSWGTLIKHRPLHLP